MQRPQAPKGLKLWHTMFAHNDQIINLEVEVYWPFTYHVQLLGATEHHWPSLYLDKQNTGLGLDTEDKGQPWHPFIRW